MSPSKSHSTEPIIPAPKVPIEIQHADRINPADAVDAIKPVVTGCECLKNKGKTNQLERISQLNSNENISVPLYRLYNPSRDDHFYTTTVSEVNNAVNTLGYYKEGISGWVFPSTADCSCNEAYIPVYRLFKAGKKSDHFYTTSVAEASNAAQNLQYKWEGVAFYCATKQGDCKDCGSKAAFYRYYRNIDHFYTTSLNEGFSNVIPYGGKYEGILCYIWTKP